MGKLAIKSDTKGKLNKIISGVVYSDPYVFITEFFQNSHRVNAKKVIINLDINAGTLSFSDNGKGLKQVSDLLTLDYSSWASTKEGFGIGFWSWLGFDMKDKENDEVYEVICNVKSKKYGLEMSKIQILKDEEPTAELIALTEKYPGFIVTLHSELFKRDDVISEVKSRILSDGELMPYDVVFNDRLIIKKDILNEVHGDYVKSFSNKLFDATLTVKTYSSMILYYEKRKVREYYQIDNVGGAIELKQGTLSLKEPDRRDYVYDSKYHQFTDKMKECSIELYKEFLISANEDLINQYAEQISNILEVSDYEKLLNIDDTVTCVNEEKRTIAQSTESAAIDVLKNIINNQNLDSDIILAEETLNDMDRENVTNMLNTVTDSQDTKWVQTEEFEPNISDWVTTSLDEEKIKTVDKLIINGMVWKKLNTSDFDNITQEDQDIETDITFKSCSTKKKKTKLIDIIRKEKRKVWVDASELEDLANLVAKAKYYKIKVFVAKNILYKKVFEKRGISHITEINSGIKKRNIIKNVELKNKKEKRVIQILQPICAYYKLDFDTFYIGNLEIYVETKLQEVTVDREIVRNTKDNISVYGVTDGSKIILDRKALNLGRFNFSESDEFGKTEFRVILAMLNTVSHELAHLLYGTEDNTVEHYKKQDAIMEEIQALYNSL